MPVRDMGGSLEICRVQIHYGELSVASRSRLKSYLSGCLYFICQRPDSSNVTSFEIMSIKLASSSPMRLARIALISGSIPLHMCKVSRAVGRCRFIYLDTMTNGISLALHQAKKSLKPGSTLISKVED